MSQSPVSREPREIAKVVSDLQYAILDLLPQQGKKVGLLNDQTISVKLIRERVNAVLPPGAPQMTSSFVGGQVRSLAAADLAHVVRDLGGRTAGWQRTPRADDVLAILRRERGASALIRSAGEESASDTAPVAVAEDSLPADPDLADPSVRMFFQGGDR